MYILLYGFWLLLNGRFTLEIAIIGLVLDCALAILMKVLFNYSLKKEWRVIKKLPLFIIYGFVLFWEIIKSSLVVCRDILFKKYKLNPTLVTFHTDLKTNMGRYLLANSITLTPGTITVKVENDKITVHCLDEKMLDTSKNSTFQRWIRKLEA
ncbi:MAG: Na+/H+ antiporter subunit E [Clostridia bacterium]|nr:Na+/H+ antiporter subunit E [Clostridia bacterium]